MDFKDLSIIETIYNTQNITKAANSLYMTQPTLTYRINKIEKEYGYSILIRRSKGVEFTHKGLLLVNFAKKTLEEWKHLENQVTPLSNSESKPLRLGLSTVISKLTFPQLFENFSNQYKDIKISITSGSSTLELPQALQKNQLDIAIIRGNLKWDGPQVLLKEEPYYIIAHHIINKELLMQSPWICYKSSKITQNNQQLNKWWYHYFSIAPSKTTILLDSIEAAIEMVKHDLGWTIIPEIYLPLCSTLNYTPVIQKNGEFITRQTTLAYQKFLINNVKAQIFINYIKEYYHQEQKQKIIIK